MVANRHTILKVLLVLTVPPAVLAFAGARYVTSTEALRATVEVQKVDIGIPGISKMYAAKLSNAGILPVRVTACDFVDDAFSSGTMVAYAVERWDQTAQAWLKVVEWGPDSFCKPYPLGIIKASVVKRWIWPGKSLSTAEEATAARRGFRRGDTARFVIFAGPAGQYKKALPTPAFTIDEEVSQPGFNLRVSH
jgi:hypothetical protein